MVRHRVPETVSDVPGHERRRDDQVEGQLPHGSMIDLPPEQVE
jgi:hypothetical protein